MNASSSGRLAMRGTLYLAMLAAAASLGGSTVQNLRRAARLKIGRASCRERV